METAFMKIINNANILNVIAIYFIKEQYHLMQCMKLKNAENERNSLPQGRTPTGYPIHNKQPWKHTYM